MIDLNKTSDMKETFGLYLENYFVDIGLNDLIFSIFNKRATNIFLSELKAFLLNNDNLFFVHDGIIRFKKFLFNQLGIKDKSIQSDCFLDEKLSKIKDAGKDDTSILYRLALLGFSSFLLERKINVVTDLYKMIDDNYKNRRKNVYYRGQHDCDLPMSPTVLRNSGLKTNAYFDDDHYKFLTQNYGLDGKFNKRMRHGMNSSVSGLYAYQKYAFFQHACSFSPLIDLTSDGIVALSFALSNPNNLNIFYNCDSCVFEIKCLNDDNVIKSSKDATHFLKNEMHLFYLNNKYLSFGKRYSFPDSRGITFNKECSTYREIYEILKPKFKIIDCPTNDRMHYQSGAFIVFYGCVTLKSRIFYEFSDELLVRKNIINKKDKVDLLNVIYKDYRERDPEHLMNPYLYFNE